MFTAPRAGVYLITFSYLVSNDPGEATYVYICKNGAEMSSTQHYTSYRDGGYGLVGSTGGRAVYQRVEAGDTLTLQTSGVTGSMRDIIFCVEFINN